MTYKWNRKDIKKNMKLFNRELERLHKLLLTDEHDFDIDKKGIEEEIKKIHEHMLTVSKRMTGLEY